MAGRRHLILPLALLGSIWFAALALWSFALVDFGIPFISDVSTNLRTYCFGWTTGGGPDIGRTLAMATTPIIFSGVIFFFWRQELLGSRPGRKALAFMSTVTLVGFVGIAAANASSGPTEQFLVEVPRTEAPDFELTDQEGEPFALSDAKDKVVALTFFYTCCVNTCPDQIGKLKAVQSEHGDRLGKELMIVAVSMDPVRDDQYTLRQYALKQGCAREGWKFLSGEKDKIKEILDGYKVAYGIPDRIGPTTQIGHSALIVLIDREGRRAFDLAGTEWPDEAITDKVALLLDEK